MNLSLESLKKEHMLQKVSIYYKGKDITLEDMVSKVKFLKKLQIPFGFSFCQDIGSLHHLSNGKQPSIIQHINCTLFWTVVFLLDCAVNRISHLGQKTRIYHAK